MSIQSYGKGAHFYSTDSFSRLRVIIPREEQGIKEFDDKEFLTRKTDKENKEFTSIKKALLRLKLSFWRGKNTKICYLKNIYA